MSARDVIAKQFKLSHQDSCYPTALDGECDIAAEAILSALAASGHRIVGPGEVDAEVKNNMLLSDAVWLEGLAFVSTGDKASRLTAIAYRIRAALRTLTHTGEDGK